MRNVRKREACREGPRSLLSREGHLLCLGLQLNDQTIGTFRERISELATKRSATVFPLFCFNNSKE